MKTVTGLFDNICDFETLYTAYRNARKGKRYRKEVLTFTANLEENIISIQEDLLNGTYHIGDYRQFIVTVPKRRLITALRFRDRVVQWAVYLYVNPIFDATFIEHSYGCRVGKGVTPAAYQLQKWLQAVDRKPGKWYYLKLDMAKFFYSVNHQILLDILARKISDPRLMDLLKLIIDTGNRNTTDDFTANAYPVNDSDVGLPIGNLTSQMFANIYLNELDYFCKHELHLHYYIRYMDDVIILFNDKAALHEIKNRIEQFVNLQLGLRLNSKTAIRPTSIGVEFVGRRIYATHIVLRKDTVLKMKGTLKYRHWQLKCGYITADKYTATAGSYNGLLSHCSSYNLRCKLVELYGDSLQLKGR